MSKHPSTRRHKKLDKWEFLRGDFGRLKSVRPVEWYVLIATTLFVIEWGMRKLSDVEREQKKRRNGRLKLKSDNEAKLAEYLHAHPCEICGMKDIRTLDFVSIQPWEIVYISRMKYYQWPRILRELKGCIVLCANCRAIRSSPV